MKVALYLIIFLTSLHLLAADNIGPVAKKAVSIISDLNQNKLLAAPCATCFQEPAINNKMLLNKCAVDLCGPVSQNKTVWLTDTNFSSGIASDSLEKTNKLTSDIEDLFDVSKNKRLADIKELKKILSDKSINIPSDQKYFIDDRIFGPYVEEETNLKASPDKRIEVKLKNTERLSPTFLKALKNYAANLEASKVSNLPIEYRQIYSEKDLSILLKLNIEKLQKFQNKNSQKLKSVNFDGDIQSLTTKASGKLTYAEFDLAMINIRFIAGTFSRKTNESPLASASCEIPECGNVYFQDLKIEESKEKIHNLDKWLNSAETKKRAVNKCKAWMISADTKTSDARKASKVFDEAKKNTNEKVLKRFSEHSRKILSNYLNNQLTASNLNINKELLEEKDPFNYFKKASSKYLEESKKRSDYTLIETLMSLQDDSESLESFDYMKVCGGEKPAPVWDAFVSLQKAKNAARENPKSVPQSVKDMKQDHIFISTFSCEHSDHGKHYIAHEIGHALNSIFAKGNLSKSSMEDYNKLKNCAINNYNGDTTYVEEDTADLFADIASPDDTNIYTCAFLQPNLDNTAYENLSLYSPREDTHSSALTRVLFEAINRDLLIPSSCQELMKDANTKIRFNKCI